MTLGNRENKDSHYVKSRCQYSVQFSSVAQSCPTLCDPMNRRTPGLPVHHQLPEFTQTHAHRVGDAIQPSHPLLSPPPPGPNPSQVSILGEVETFRSGYEGKKTLCSTLKPTRYPSPQKKPRRTKWTK